MTPSRALFWFCISFAVGIALESITTVPQIFIWGLLILGALFVVIKFFDVNLPSVLFVFQKYLLVVGFCMLCVTLGIMRLQITEFNIANDSLRKLNDSKEKVTLVGKVVSEPERRDGFQKLRVKVNDSVILVTSSSYPEYHYLDEIKIIGNLKTPIEFEDFSYKNYLLKDNIYSVIDFPKIELVSNKHHYNVLSFLYEKILFLKTKLISGISVNFSSPQDSIIKGIVFGKDSTMPEDLKNKFNSAGLSHLTAVSGGNIVILTSLLMFLLLLFGLWRNQAFYFSIIFIWLYVVIVGFPASGVRAVIMASIFLVSQYLGRQNTSSRTILLAAALMLLHNPLLLFYDVGFQLSFLASMGIIHVKPIIDAVLPFKQLVSQEKSWKAELYKKGKYFLDILSVTLAVQIFTLPIMMYNFNNVSLIAPITNVLVLPIIPLLMVLGFLTSIFGIFSGFLGWIFALPCYATLFYFQKVLDIFYQPWATKSFEDIPWPPFLIYYLALSVLIFYLNRKIKPKFLGY